jgi:hypothetical protein
LPRQTTYVVKQGRVIRIGEDFGDKGVHSLCVADLKGNGQPYLVYSFTFGSGDTQTHIGALNCLAKDPTEIRADKALVLDPAHEWKVRNLDKKTVRVEGGGVSFGNLELVEKDGKAMLKILLPDDLPEMIKKKVSPR